MSFIPAPNANVEATFEAIAFQTMSDADFALYCETNVYGSADVKAADEPSLDDCIVSDARYL